MDISGKRLRQYYIVILGKTPNVLKLANCRLSNPSHYVDDIAEISFKLHFGDCMGNTIRAGDMIIVKTNRGKLRKGDIVTFHHPGMTTIFAHRIYAVYANCISTRGDLNLSPDTFTINQQMIIGKVIAKGRNGVWIDIKGGWRGRIIGAYYRTRNRAWRALGRRCGWIYRGLGDFSARMLERCAIIAASEDESSSDCRQGADAPLLSAPSQAEPRPGLTPPPGQNSLAEQGVERIGWPGRRLGSRLRERLRLRLVEFARPRGVETHLFLGDKAIGKRQAGPAGEAIWRIRFPYRLLVNPVRLPSGMNREGAKDARKDATQQISRRT